MSSFSSKSLSNETEILSKSSKDTNDASSCVQPDVKFTI